MITLYCRFDVVRRDHTYSLKTWAQYEADLKKLLPTATLLQVTPHRERYPDIRAKGVSTLTARVTVDTDDKAAAESLLAKQFRKATGVWGVKLTIFTPSDLEALAFESTGR